MISSIKAAVLVRAVMLVYGAWHDTYMEVKYTDIDYDVFSDAAELIWHGRSPFERSTYRYTPLLALVLTPNVWLHHGWGKLLFAAIDVAIGAQIESILVMRHLPLRVARTCAAVWLLNPLSINVSTRGNSESLVAVFVLGAVHALMSHRTMTSALLLAIGVHFKPYPIIYLPAFLACMDSNYRAGLASVSKPVSNHEVVRQMTARFPRGTFLLSFLCMYGILSAICLAWCGPQFWREALLYHVTRQDAKHNFSPYFYGIYLSTADGTMWRSTLATFAFVPQVLLLARVVILYRQDLPFCLFVQTLIFVTFNKVCTAQYFIWYHALLPLVLPSSRTLQRPRWCRSLGFLSFWVITLLSWLGWAYQLEFRGRAVFLQLWIASLAFFAANIVVLCEMILAHQPTPLFRNGVLLPQACVILDGSGPHKGAPARTSVASPNMQVSDRLQPASTSRRRVRSPHRAASRSSRSQSGRHPSSRGRTDSKQDTNSGAPALRQRQRLAM